jgi:predicted TIM-barrel fold metal-dependent hydrolase
MIVSADSHVAAPAADYVEYLDPQYRAQGETYLRDIQFWHQGLGLLGYPFPPEVLDVVDDRGAIRRGGELGYFEPDFRLRETSAEGVVAELLHPQGPTGVVPFYDAFNQPSSPELRAAGARAHNRFLTDFCSVAPHRLFGVYLIYPWPDAQAAADQCRKARDAGAPAVFCGQQAGVPGDPCPALYDPFWDPFWAACQELELVVHIHAGFGHPQGTFLKTLQEASAEGDITNDAPGPRGEQTATLLAESFDSFDERRPLWQLMLGGVFDRFPRLKIAFVEVHCDWIPETLAYLEARHAEDPSRLRLSPTEYWHRHCAVGASLMRYSDVSVRHEVGLDKVMFGTDYPHMEGAWPNTRAWIRTVLGRLPEHELRAILGENAVTFYGLDRDALVHEARRVGPLPTELLGEQNVSSALLAQFHARSGIDKQMTLHAEQLAEAYDEDRAGAARFSGRLLSHH